MFRVWLVVLHTACLLQINALQRIQIKQPRSVLVPVSNSKLHTGTTLHAISRNQKTTLLPTNLSFSVAIRRLAIYTRQILQMKEKRRSIWRLIPLLAPLLLGPRRVQSSVMIGSSQETSSMTPLQGLLVWAALFGLSATLHAAESAITKLSTWKVLVTLYTTCSLHLL